jgi:hypothetical protein
MGHRGPLSDLSRAIQLSHGSRPDSGRAGLLAGTAISNSEGRPLGGSDRPASRRTRSQHPAQKSGNPTPPEFGAASWM